MKKLFLLCTVLVASCYSIDNAFAQSKVNIQYQKRQKIDLEDLSIQGELISPGDFSIESEKMKKSKDLFKRLNYNDRLRMNLKYVY